MSLESDQQLVSNVCALRLTLSKKELTFNIEEYILRYLLVLMSVCHIN